MIRDKIKDKALEANKYVDDKADEFAAKKSWSTIALLGIVVGVGLLGFFLGKVL